MYNMSMFHVLVLNEKNKMGIGHFGGVGGGCLNCSKCNVNSTKNKCDSRKDQLRGWKDPRMRQTFVSGNCFGNVEELTLYYKNSRIKF